MEDNIKITYPDSEKVYLKGEIHPDVRVAMRRVNLTPTVTIEDGRRVTRENAPVYVYDTSGVYSDPSVEVDLRKGLPRLREAWIRSRDVEVLPDVWQTRVLIICVSNIFACPIERKKVVRCRRCTMLSRVSLPLKWNM